MDVRMRGNVHTASTSRTSTSQRLSDNKLSRSNSKSKNDASVKMSLTSCICGMILAIIIVILGTISGFITLTNATSAIETKNQIRGEKVKETNAGVDKAHQKELELVRKQNRDLLDRLTKTEKLAKNIAADTPDTKALNSRISRLVQKSERMQNMLQLISKRYLVQKYGEGPHYVEMLLSFDPQSNIADSTKPKGEDTALLLIQMAPIDEMPATVLWFLEQVNATIYDGTSFHRNAHHVVQGGPIGNFETTDKGKSFTDKIRNTGLDSVPFQEYSPNFPHVKYTLGYAGRPGGPDFYVSTQDNTRNHGPGGQSSYEEASEADPCFAKVVPGYEHVVDRMHKSDVAPGNYMRMKHYVAIRQMRLVPSNEAVQVLNT